MLTERQAWLKLAKDWDGARPDVLGYYFVGWHYGLCVGIGNLGVCGQITSETAIAMKGRLPKLRPDTAYCWPNTKAGAKARADFCREQAALLTKKPKKKGKVKS